ncbi:hypothetical protein HDZ31DRAFT_50028 [Schizophyllum fasciatum]
MSHENDLLFLEDFLLSNPLADDEMRERVLHVANVMRSASNELSPQQVDDVLAGLPRLTEQEVKRFGHKDAVCPICYNTLLAVLAEEEMATAMESPAHPIEELGVTRLAADWQCGHVFCRRDISKWIRDGHDSCPACRAKLVQRSEARTDPDLSGIPPPPGEAGQGPPLGQGPGSPIHIQVSPLDFSSSDIFTAFLGSGIGANFDLLSPPPGAPRAADDDDRHEFSGMYS